MEGLTNLETRQENIDAAFATGLLKISRAVEKDDRVYGVDAWLDDNIPIAFRRRPTTSLHDYEGAIITIRISKPETPNWIKCEYDKLLSGQFKAILYFFKLTDALVIVPTIEIVQYLKNNQRGGLNINFNKKGMWDLICIRPDQLGHVIVISLTTPFT